MLAGRERATSLKEFLLIVGKLRRAWRVARDQELWFRAEDSAHRHTRLQPGLYRSAKKKSLKKLVQDLLGLENTLWEEFGRCASQLSPADMQSIDDDRDSYFLMQHHGVPTRLLDWTDGALIALHFAVRGKPRRAPSGSVIYILDPYWFMKTLDREPD